MIGRLGLSVLVAVAVLAGGADSSPRKVRHATPLGVLAAAHAAKLTDAQVSDRVFAFGDRLEAVDYELGFTGDARNADATAQQCRSLLVEHEALKQALAALHSRAARAVGPKLLAAAASTVDACRSTPPAADEASAERAYTDFSSYRDIAFDFADLVAGKRA